MQPEEGDLGPIPGYCTGRPGSSMLTSHAYLGSFLSLWVTESGNGLSNRQLAAVPDRGASPRVGHETPASVLHIARHPHAIALSTDDGVGRGG